MSETLLQVSGLEAGYASVQILHGLSLAVTKGSVTALIGGNGAGKTTFMKVIAGLLGASGGTIRYAGTDVTGWPASRRVNAGLVLVPEGRLIFPQLTVRENLRLGAVVQRARSTALQQLSFVEAMFPRLRERARQHGGTLSGGEQQMLAIGRGLMAKPELLLLDEPTLGLAPIMAQTVFDAIARLHDQGITILIAEQDVPRTLQLADTAYVIENGRIVLSGSGRELISDPTVREAYLGL